MLNLIYSEFYKLEKSISLKICFLLTCISAAALVYLSHSVAVGSIGAEVTNSATGLTEIFIVSLLGSLMTGILICSDFETKTIHDSVACGKGRVSVILSKVLIYLFQILLLLLPYMTATLIGFCSKARFSEAFALSAFTRILSEEAGVGVTAGSVGKIIIVSFIIMLVYAARLSICIPIAFKLKKPVAILAIGFSFSFLIDLVSGLVKDVPVISDIMTVTPFTRDFIQLSIQDGSGTLIKAAICSLIFIGVMTAVTYLLFRKDDIK